MNIYFAPLEGITQYPFRMAHVAAFSGIDRYYMPFITVHQSRHFRTKEKADLLPEHNPEGNSYPQLLGNDAGETIWYLRHLREKGYQQVDLNLGCPSGTVTAKGRGAGFLRDPEALDRFFESVFEGIEGEDISITVKCRIGIDDPSLSEWLIPVYNRYPIQELTVHPRLQKQFYRGEVDLDTFALYAAECRIPLCYNGDICTVQDLQMIQKRFPEIQAVMIGRGMLKDPALARQIRGGMPASRKEIRDFHDSVYEGWCQAHGDPVTAIGRMKELWGYMEQGFAGGEKYKKKLRKAKRREEYLSAVEELFANCSYGEEG